EQDDAGGDGDVEAFEAAGHGDVGQVVAVLAGQAAQAVGFPAQHQGDVAGEVQAVEGGVGVAGQAVDPDAQLLQLAQGAGQVGGAHDRHDVGGAGRGLAHGGIDLHRLVPGDDHGGGAGGGGAAQAGAEVVRVLDAVEHQHQGLAAGGSDQPGQVLFVPGLRRDVACGDALVAQAA